MLMINRINFAHLDFGDGNYLYISQRMADGLILYKDIVSPQPPLHLLVGSVLVALSDDIETKITVVRTFSIALHVATMLLIVAIAYTIWGVARTATLAGLIYLVLPIGLWWGQGYQSEPLLLVLMCGTFLALLRGGVVGLAAAAVLSVLACFTNMTFLPYLGLHLLYVLGRYRRNGLWLWYVVPFLSLAVATFLLFNNWSGGAYVENVWSNQVGSFPREGTLQYVVQKITFQGLEVLQHEGAFILLAMLGMLSQWRFQSVQAGISTHYVVWYGLASLGSLIFVAKGGTVQYIFTLGEPMVAIFAAFYLYRLHEQYLSISLASLGWIAGAARVTTLILLTFVLTVPTYIMTTRMASDELPYRLYERSHQEVVQIIRDIERHSPSKGLVLAPPYYAFVSGRRLAGECPETFLVGIRYLNEYSRLCDLLNRPYPFQSRSVRPATRETLEELQNQAVRAGVVRVEELDHGIVEIVDRVATRLERQEVHYVLLNVEPRQAFSRIVRLWNALEERYVPARDELYYGREEQLRAYKPARDGARAPVPVP